MPPRARLFLLSPATCGGERARKVLSDRASSPLAQQLRSPGGAPIGDVFSFLSGLYFRGKLTYARRFARPANRRSACQGGGVLVITPGAGLCPAETPVTVETVRGFAEIAVEAHNHVYRRPLEDSAARVAAEIGRRADVVLLGSIATAKYIDVLQAIFGDRLLFPAEFVGRGDMSRGGLLLRQVLAGRELDYVPAAGAVRHGPRPPKLQPLR